MSIIALQKLNKELAATKMKVAALERQALIVKRKVLHDMEREDAKWLRYMEKKNEG